MANAVARNLRKRLTPQEAKLWVRLRLLKPMGFHFRRQAPIGSYIVDFACFSRRLVVEVDGGQHGFGQQELRDSERDRILKAQGSVVLRFWNTDVDHNRDGVVEHIVSAVMTPHPDRLTPVDPPHKGEG